MRSGSKRQRPIFEIKMPAFLLLISLTLLSFDSSASRRLQETEKLPLEKYVLGYFGQRPSGEKYFMACAPDGHESRVLVRDFLGKRYGKVLRIERSRFLIQELIEVSEGDWQSRSRWVPLLTEMEYLKACPGLSSE